MHSPLLCLILIFTFFITYSSSIVTATATTTHIRYHRRLLHQPLYPFHHSKPPVPSPNYHPFFSLFPPPPPPPAHDDLATFPANISSLTLPHSSHSANNSISSKFIGILVSASVLSAAFITALILSFFLYHHRHRHEDKSYDHERTDRLRLVPPNATPSHAESSSRQVNEDGAQSSTAINDTVSVNYYQGFQSPELRPLPPLPRQSFIKHRKNEEVGSFEDEEEEKFFSPRVSSGFKGSPYCIQRSSNAPSEQSSHKQNQYTYSHSSNDSSRELNYSPMSKTSKSPDTLVNFPALKRFIRPPMEQRSLSSSSGSTYNSPASQISGSSMQIPDSSMKQYGNPGNGVSIKLPPPPPPPPRPRFWEASTITEPLVVEKGGAPLPALSKNNEIPESSEAVERKNEESNMKPKLKPLHWDKVKASSDRAMVWDQLKSSSFQLNEEMIETLFTINSSNFYSKDGVRRPTMNQETQVLDFKKSQNIAILLKALQITSDEVREALLQGNADTLGVELLESLIKMAPTKEEERKLKDISDESAFKLGPAEKFLKALLDIPFAFKRVDAMHYMTSFGSEVEYLKRSFQTLENACEELRNSRTFLKLLQAVLTTGNHMNVGTNRGDACAFKLDTLLKLVDIKGDDGKTTLLHFILHETIRAEGSHLSSADLNPNMEKNQLPVIRNEAEFRKTGLQVVSGLSKELTNVKKAAGMDTDILSNEVAKLAAGVSQITDVLKLNKEMILTESSRNFSESMNGFLQKAEKEIVNIQAQEDVALSMVKELTEYFHGDLAKEEARPIRIFMVVRDFLSILDQVCKDFRENNRE